MLALPSSDHRAGGVNGACPSAPVPRESDWLPLQQAACELGISPSTARRMIRRGQLRNRVVARPGGFAYLVYLPDSWHARLTSHGHTATPPRNRDRVRIAHVGTELQRVARGLLGSLRIPPSGQLVAADAGGPFARYRWLARRRRWWRF